MPLKEIYIDPAINADTGAGTVGSPYGDLRYAIQQETQGTEGTRLNIKRGTDEVCLGDYGAQGFADTSVTPAWAYSYTNPIIFQGYDTVAGDLAGTGHGAGISGNGANMILNGALALNVHFIDLHLHSTGTQGNGIVRCFGGCSLIRCELDNNIGRGALMGSAALVIGCYFHNFSTFGIDLVSGIIHGNIVRNAPARKMSQAIHAQAGVQVTSNIIAVDGATHGINVHGSGVSCISNSIFSAGGTGAGIFSPQNGIYLSNMSNNIIEGFSGAGGAGIKTTGTSTILHYAARNLIFNCSAATDLSNLVGPVDTGGLSDFYEVLSSSAFVNAASMNFNPVNVGNVKEGAYPPACMVI
jgi:hypothetical protein